MNASIRDSGGGDFLCIGDRFYGIFPTLIWKSVHSPSCGLCILMSLSKKSFQHSRGVYSKEYLKHI